MKKAVLTQAIKEILKEEFFKPDNSVSEKLYKDLLNILPDSTSYKDLATAIIKLIKEDYGDHNIEPFLKLINQGLKPE